MARRTVRSLLALSFALAGVALAQESRFAVEGDNVAGRATFSRPLAKDGDQAVLQLDAVRTSKKDRAGVPFTVRGQARRTGGALELSTTRKKGFLGSLLGSDEEQVVVRLSALPGGGWAGELEGQSLRLLPEVALPENLAVLVVPGLSTNLWNQYGVPYLDENLAVLRARGLNARRLAINTEQSVRLNALMIGEEIRKEVQAGKRVLLIAHSKGGADTITALSDPVNLDLLPHVAGLIAIQPVYAGSPVADEVGKSGLVQTLADKAFSCIFPLINKVDDTGSGDAVRDLRSQARGAALQAHPYPADRIPTVVIRGHFSKRSLSKFNRHPLCQPLVGLQIFLEKRRGLQSDGMVSLPNQSIPGAVAEFTYDDLDHFEPGFRNESAHTPTAITAKALELMLPRLKR